MSFESVASRADFPGMEAATLARWEAEGTFQRSIDNRRHAPAFVFYEGPPTANGYPHLGHVVQRALKDLFPRYRTMRGYRCERRAGWDTHGLPVEIQVEKELGLTGKAQIEEYGIAEFNQRCRENVFRHVDVWREFTRRLGFWIDLDNAFVPYQSAYIESVWAILKRTWDQGLLYQGYKVVPYCPRCSTPLSSHELSLGYRDGVEDPSVYVRFRLLDEPGTSMLAWTTTPWTLPGNVALAVGPDIEYVKVRQGDEHLILAEARLGELEGEHEVVARLRASDLVGRRYEPLFPYLIPEEPAFVILEADFVTTGDGTGVVHTAAAYGEDDLELCRRNNVPVRHVVDLRGRFLPEVEPFAGIFVKDADPLVIANLKERGLLYRAATISHTYPFCWRCDTPLLYYALDSWFIRMSQLRETMLAENAACGWHPEHVREGRMGNWLENLQDWSLSRLRYWGTPLPIWVCADCAEKRCVGSVEELGLTLEADLHRPYIDQVNLTCTCGGTMSRVPDLIDVWFDSGSMPFAQQHWPFENQARFEEQYPADIICEGIDQTRGWFYSLLAVGVLTTGHSSYRNAVVNGQVLDPEGKKMSKSVGNVTDPLPLMDQFGSDALRWYFYSAGSIGSDYRFSPELVQDVVRRFLLKLWNTYSFLVTYAILDQWRPGLQAPAEPLPAGPLPALDAWLRARTQATVITVTEAMDEYDFYSAARALEALLNDTSDWFVRRSRRRFWKSDSDLDKASAYQTLHQSLVELVTMLAPFCPFVADTIWQNLVVAHDPQAPSSVHLADYPAPRPELVDHELLLEMDLTRRIVEAGHAARELARIKVRQPLASATVAAAPLREELAELVREELNVKALIFVAGEELKVEFDLTISDELLLEGLARELVRRLQNLRKEAGFSIEDRIRVAHRATGNAARSLETWGPYIAREVLADELAPAPGDGLEAFHGQEVKLDGEAAWLGVVRN